MKKRKQIKSLEKGIERLTDALSVIETYQTIDEIKATKNKMCNLLNEIKIAK